MGDLVVAVSLFANDRGRSGIGRYLVNVLSALAGLREPGLQLRCFVAEEDVPVFSQAVPEEGAGLRYVKVDDFWNDPARSVLWHLARFPARARDEGARVIYLPAGNRRLAPLASLPTVAVIHDLSAFHVKGKYDPARMLYIKRVLPWMMKRTSRVIAISRATAEDVTGLAGFPAERMSIVGNGYDARCFFPRSAEASRGELRAKGIHLPEAFLLYVSRIEHPGKNHVGLLRAYRLLLDRLPRFPYDLVFAGSRWNGAEAVDAAVSELGLSRRVHLMGYVGDDILPHLYTTARALVFPSLFEGFGLPVLEAQGSGLPVAASAISSIPEVVGEGGLLFDPHDPESIARSVERISLDEALRGQLVERGALNARAFTWETTARKTVDVLREVALA